jgi:hypothetical protein
VKESTKISLKSTVIATLIATAVGIWAMQLGVARVMWPSHPQLMAFILTLIACIVAKPASASWMRTTANRSNS